MATIVNSPKVDVAIDIRIAMVRSIYPGVGLFEISFD